MPHAPLVAPTCLAEVFDEDGAVKTVGPLYEGQSYGIAFPQGSELREKVTITILKFMEDGTYKKLYKQWFGTNPK